MLLNNSAHYSFFRVVRFDEIMSQRTGECKSKQWIHIKEWQNSLMTLCVLLHGTQRIKLFNQNRCGGCFYFQYDPPPPSAVDCEMHVLYTPSCSKTQAHYITLHLSCQTHWTHADLGSTEVIRCISITMPHSFGIHQCPDICNDKSIKKKKQVCFQCCCVSFLWAFSKQSG